jgi:16S rRNA G527 N7-methylase RsmG
VSAAPLARLAAAAAEWGNPLDAAALGRLDAYLKEVRERNRTVNLTADDAWEDLVLKHGADGVYAAACLRAARRRGRACSTSARAEASSASR